MSRFKTIAETDPRLNAFGTGQRYDILTDIKYYPYLWIVSDISHDILYTEVNKYRAIEFNFVLRLFVRRFPGWNQREMIHLI
jgi:hypothetical protein